MTKIAPTKKATFDLRPEIARRLALLKQELQFDLGFAPSEASALAIVEALIEDTSAKQVARLLRKSRKTR